MYPKSIENIMVANAKEKTLIEERQRIIKYLQDRIDKHFGCRGSQSCPTCTSFRQVIGFVSVSD